MSPVTGPDVAVADDLLLAAEVAEAEAVAAEARADAARARAKAAQLRREAGSRRSAPSVDDLAERDEAVDSDEVDEAADSDEVTGATSASADVSASEGTNDARPTTADAGGPTTADAGGPTTADAGGPATVGDGGAVNADSPDRPEKTASAQAGAAEKDSAGEPAGEDESPGRLRRLRTALAAHPRRTALQAAAVLTIAAALVTSALLGYQHREAAAQERRAGEFAAAAKQGVVALTTLDFTHAAADVQRVLDNSTGTFRDDFQGRSADFTSVIEQSQVATEGTVNAVAVESMTDDSAVVLVAATSKVTNSGGAQQEPRAWRLSVTVQREGDTMRMSKVEFVP
ncbi:hypothetical protein [Nocardia asteroides]|uniref:hypothetical protein n=1 Tax=Nocardia asteroides TaxID=1824 RepID=UPI001E420FF3|nr:hypothetical protein [Nocardia asteroides]UGT61300.1 hypothetical protein LTT61_29925 [Nocardia asteroides]